MLAPRHGFEPRFTAPKAAVLPLDDRGIRVSTAFHSSVTGREFSRNAYPRAQTGKMARPRLVPAGGAGEDRE